MMMVQDFSTHPGDVEKRYISRQKSTDGGFIGGVQHRAASASLTGHLMT
jgi:hypothetical protein